MTSELVMRVAIGLVFAGVVWMVTRYDLVSKRLAPWRIAAVVLWAVIGSLWQDWMIGLFSKGLGAACVS